MARLINKSRNKKIKGKIIFIFTLIVNIILHKKGNKQLVHENYLCTWIGKPKK